MTEPVKDYHHYVFRAGKLVAEFEEMYRNSEGIPWHQDEQENWIDVRLTVEMLRELSPFTEIHDFGCGTGHYLEILHRRLGDSTSQAFGYDVSPTACTQAQALFPRFTFRPVDLTKVPTTSGNEHAGENARRLFAIRGTLWYVFPHLGTVVDHLRSFMAGGDRLLVVQNFPPLNTSFIGKDVLPNHHALIEHFSSHFSLVRHIWYEDTIKSTNDNWFIGLFSLREGK